MHLPDRRIIAFARGEGSSRSRRRAAAHLQDCPACRARLGRITEIRDAIREATAVTPPDRFDEVLERLDQGEAVILPTADPAPAGRRMTRRVAVVAAALAVSAASAVAGIRAIGPSDSPADVGDAAIGTVARRPAAGLAAPLSTDSFVVRVATPSGPTALRVGLTSGAVVEVTGVDTASRSRFQSVADGIHVSETAGGELRVSVPESATRVLVQHEKVLLLEVVNGRFLIHTHARLLGDSAVVLDLGVAAGSDSVPFGSRR